MSKKHTHLTLQERRRIEKGIQNGLTYAVIGRQIRRGRKTIEREIKRRSVRGKYTSRLAHAEYIDRKSKRDKQRIDQQIKIFYGAPVGSSAKDIRKFSCGQNNAVAALNKELFIEHERRNVFQKFDQSSLGNCILSKNHTHNGWIFDHSREHLLARLKNYRSVGANTKHGFEGTPQYGMWNSMKQKCNNPNSRQYEKYGAKGVTYCDKWEKFDGWWEDNEKLWNKAVIQHGDPQNDCVILSFVLKRGRKVFEKGGVRIKRFDGGRRMMQVEQKLENGEWVRFESAGEAHRQIGIHQSTIHRVCQKKGNHAGGYKWRYAQTTA